MTAQDKKIKTQLDNFQKFDFERKQRIEAFVGANKPSKEGFILI